VKEDEYRIMAQVEDGHWWYVGHHHLFNSLLDLHCPGAARGDVLDAGCGTGGYMQRMRERFHPRTLVGLDISDEALRFCAGRGLADTRCCSIEELPFEDASFDLVVSFNVICHYAVADDLATLREMARVLRPGGWMLLNLPAFDILRGSHDAAVGGVRRYRAPRTRGMLQEAGLRPELLTYFNTFLFPVAVAWRLWSRRRAEREEVRSDLWAPTYLNGALAALLRLEEAVALRWGLPFGVSLVALSRKP
jgi:SAM-dependent methyltransferase